MALAAASARSAARGSVLSTVDSMVRSTASSPSYHRADHTYAFAWGERRPAGSSEWISVAETYETPGLIFDGVRTVLHAGGLGLVDVYYARVGGAVYFSSLLKPLLDLVPVEIDWPA